MVSLNKGKNLVITIIAMTVVMDVLTIAYTSSTLFLLGKHEKATFEMMSGLFRFVLTLTILYFLYRGHKWARWVLGVFSFLGGTLALDYMFKSFNLWMLIIGVVYTTISLLLFLNKDIKEFLSYRRSFN